MDRIGPGQLCRGDDQVGTQVGVGRSAPTERDRLVGLGDEGRIRIRLGEHGDSGDSHRLGGAGDPSGDLAAVGHDQLGDAGHDR